MFPPLFIKIANAIDEAEYHRFNSDPTVYYNRDRGQAGITVIKVINGYGSSCGLKW